MAINVLKKNGYGILEVNNVSGGQITRSKASLPLDITDFPDTAHPCEQGMLLVYDEAKQVVRKAKAITENVYLVNAEYKLYDNRWGLKDFCLFAQDAVVTTVTGAVLKLDGTVVPALDTTTNKPSSTSVTIYEDNSAFPRLFPLLIGDSFTTNTVIYDDADYADIDAIRADIPTAGVYACVATGQTDTSLDGYFLLSKTKPAAKVVFQAVEAYDLPDGQPAIRFTVLDN